MRFALAAALTALPIALGITILEPSPSSYWVEMTTNEIVWSYNAGDPNPINIIVSAQNDTTLNGDFVIAQNIDLTLEHFTITNVTLVVGSGYSVSFANPSNGSDVYATSQSFSVMAPGTSAAPTSAVPSSGASSATSPAASSTGSAASSQSSGASPSASKSAAPRSFGVSTQAVVGILTAAGIAGASALLL